MVSNQYRTLLPLLCVFACGCTKFQALNAVVPTFGYDRTSNLIYGPLHRQTLDVYRPTCGNKPTAVVVFFYGGDWQNGSKEGYRFVAQALASRGFLTILPDYRLWPAVQFPEFVRDGALAVKWARDNAASFGGDPARIYLMGHSAGAHIAALLTLDDRYLNAVGSDRSIIHATVGLSGPYDFTPPPGDRALFGMSEVHPERDPQMEPITFVDGKEPPMLLVQGGKDTTVEPGNTTRLATRIRSMGGQVDVIQYPNVDHAGVVLSMAFPFRWIAPTLEDVTRYLREMK